MKRILGFSFLLFFAAACNSNEDQATASQPEDDLDAARAFIRANLDGKIESARKLMFEDSVNIQYFNAFERDYDKWDPETKRMFRESTINIHKRKLVNDSTSVVIFSNSYKNNWDTLKVLFVNGTWKVDLKYLFDHPDDSTVFQGSYIDSLPPRPIRGAGGALSITDSLLR